MAIEDFEYNRFKKIKYIDDGNYTAYYAKGFITLINNHVHYDGSLDHWKFHISIDDEQEGENLAIAWRIVAEILMERDIYCFKIIDPSKPPMIKATVEENGQTISQGGKQITIYSGIPPEQSKDWQRILQEITDRFVETNVCPSYLPISDLSIQGSPYFSYRHELGSRLKFSIPDDDEDPYANIVLALPLEVNIERKQWPEVKQGIQIAVVQPHHPANEEEYIEERASCCGCRCTII